MTLNELFAKHELSAVEIHFSIMRGAFTAVRNSTERLIKDNIFGQGDTPEAALEDLMTKVNSGAVARQKPAPVATEKEPVLDDLDDLLG